jgi:IS30 family transposase
MQSKMPKQKIDSVKVRELRKKGLSITDIAQHQDVHKSTILRFLKKDDEAYEILERYKENRADVFAVLQAYSAEIKAALLEQMWEDLHDPKRSLTVNEKTKLLHALSVSAGIDFDKEQLERGKEAGEINVSINLPECLQDMASC